MDIRLNEIAVAIGAPMKPSRIAGGPQTNAHDQRTTESLQFKRT